VFHSYLIYVHTKQQTLHKWPFSEVLRGPQTHTDTAVDTKGMISSPSRRTATHTLKTESNGIAAFNTAHWYLWPYNAEKHDPWLLNHSTRFYTKSDASLAHTLTHNVINGCFDAVACLWHQDVGVPLWTLSLLPLLLKLMRFTSLISFHPAWVSLEAPLNLKYGMLTFFLSLPSLFYSSDHILSLLWLG